MSKYRIKKVRECNNKWYYYPQVKGFFGWRSVSFPVIPEYVSYEDAISAIIEYDRTKVEYIYIDSNYEQIQN
jgi:hypothetical protein